MHPLSALEPVPPSSCAYILLTFLVPLARADPSDVSQASTSGAVTLASDIAPLIQLFGAGPLIQFLAHSLGSKRGMLTLFGTVGIVTAMSIYVRVHSYSWMRYMIGRAGETAEDALTEVYKLPEEGTAVLWTRRGGKAMGVDGRAVVIMKLKKAGPSMFNRGYLGVDWLWSGERTQVNASDEQSAAEEGKSKGKAAEEIAVSILVGPPEMPPKIVDPVHRVVEAWPQLTSSTISRSRCVTVGEEKILLCVTTALGGATLRSQIGRKKVLVTFYLLCLLTLLAQGALAYFMWKAGVQTWLITSSHALYYISFAILLWRLLSVDQRRSVRERLREKHKFELQSLSVLQPGVLSDDSSMPELVTFPENENIDFVIYPPELDDAICGRLGQGQVLSRLSNRSNLQEMRDSFLLACLVVGYLLYFTALSTMKTLLTFLVLAAIGPSLMAKGLINTVEASHVRPETVSVAAGRSDVAAVLTKLLTPASTSADMTRIFIDLVFQLKLQPMELEPALEVYNGEWISFVSVGKGHRRYSPDPLFAFETVNGMLPLGLLVRLWLIAGDVTPHVDLPERIDGLAWAPTFSQRANGAGPENKNVLNNWSHVRNRSSNIPSQQDRPEMLKFRINGNWYQGHLCISKKQPEKYIPICKAQDMARSVQETETTLEYALLERDWMQATGCRGWDSGSRHATITPRMLNTLELEYGVKAEVSPDTVPHLVVGAPSGGPWVYSGDERPGSRGG